MISAFIFWVAVLVLFHTYAGYPILLQLVSLFASNPVKKQEAYPMVTLIISVYNEERVIREKLENALALDYPKEKLEILVPSDGSTDRTHDIVNEFKDQGVRLIIQEGRLGKTAALNLTVPQAKGEVIVFTDANSMYDPKAIRMLVENFADITVGCVTGETRLVNPEGTALGENEKTFYSYDTFLKIKESAICSTVGGDGAIFAIRKELYRPLDPAIINDFVIPLQVVAKGFRVIYEPRAYLKEVTATTLKGGFGRRVRIINRALFGAFSEPKVFNPFITGFFSVQVVSRKLLRWTAPLFIILVFIANLFLLDDLFYRLTFILQVLFYALALFRVVAGEKVKSRLFNFPYYFCHGNLAALVAFIKFLKGERIVVWEPLRR